MPRLKCKPSCAHHSFYEKTNDRTSFVDGSSRHMVGNQPWPCTRVALARVSQSQRCPSWRRLPVQRYDSLLCRCITTLPILHIVELQMISALTSTVCFRPGNMSVSRARTHWPPGEPRGPHHDQFYVSSPTLSPANSHRNGDAKTWGCCAIV